MRVMKLMMSCSRKLRQFFERRQWPMVMELAQVMAAVVKACVSCNHLPS